MNAILSIVHIDDDFAVGEIDHESWHAAENISVKNYWSGEAAPKGRKFAARPLWSDTALYVRFEADQAEPLVVSDQPDLSRKAMQLWERDVCEIFIAPDRSQPDKYFEFEIAPTGEWIDLGIEITAEGRNTDWEYDSRMTSAARIGQDRVVMTVKIPFASLGKTPKFGDVWLGNLFRCVGSAPTRGFLAWRPTKTKTPNFHVPEAFGEFVFV